MFEIYFCCESIVFMSKIMTRLETTNLSISKEIVNKVCRTCTLPLENGTGGNVLPIFDEASLDGYSFDRILIANELRLLNVEVKKDDGLPQVICKMCYDMLDNVRDFRNLAQESQIILRKQFHTHTKLPEHHVKEESIGIKEELVNVTSYNNQISNYVDIKDFQLNLDNYDGHINNVDENGLKVFESCNESDTNEHSYKCWYCYESFLFVKELLDHEREHDEEKYHNCVCCHKSYKTANDLKHHEKLHSKDPRTLQCEYCGRIMYSIKSLTNHRNKVHSKNPNRNSDKKKYDPFLREYKCPLCSQCFVIPQALEKHMKLHDKNRKYRCDECGVGYNRRDHLNRHINTAHTKQMLYSCEYCGEGFLTDANKIYHVRRHFNSYVNCDQCGKVYDNIILLRAHKRRHKTELKYPCKVCDKAFATGRSLSEHQRKHTKDQLELAGQNFLEDVLKKQEINI